MACESLEQSLADLKRQETDQQDLIKGLTGHPLEAAKARLTVIEGEIATTSVTWRPAAPPTSPSRPRRAPSGTWARSRWRRTRRRDCGSA